MNKKLTKLLSVFVLAGVIGTGAAFNMTGCKKKDDNAGGGGGQQQEQPQNAVTGVTASADKTTAKKGETVNLSATVAGTGTFSQDVTWAITLGEDSATLSGNVLTLKEIGTVKVQATSVTDTTKKSNEVTILVEPAVIGDKAVLPEYSAPAAGPTAGLQDICSEFNTGKNIGEVKTLSEDFVKGVFTIKAGSEIRSRGLNKVYSPDDGTTVIDANASFTHSIKNGTIELNASAPGTLKIYASNGSTSKYSALDMGALGSYTFKTQNKNTVEITVQVTAAGKYTFTKTEGTVDIVEMTYDFKADATPYTGIEIASKGVSEYLLTQKVDCTGIAVNAIDQNDVRYEVSLENCEIDASAYNPNVPGEYDIGVTLHLESNLTSETKELKTSYKVKVYAIESINLHKSSFASNTQRDLMQACLPGTTFSDANLTVMAKCKLGTDTIDYKLKDGWYEVSTPTLTAEGKQTVSVSVNRKYTVDNAVVEEDYDIIVKNKIAEQNGKVEITVGENGDFETLTQAVQYLKACSYDVGVYKVIKLEAGTYNEKVWLDVDNVTIIGQGATKDDTVLTYSAIEDTEDLTTGNKYGLYCATLHVTGKNFKAYNLAIRNDFDYIHEAKKYASPQGLALGIAGDGAVLHNVHLYGNQDTLYLRNGRTYFTQCQIDGNIDFIFGEATGLAYFDECKIVAIDREGEVKADPQNGYVTAAKHTEEKKPDYGYIFNNCEFTDDGNVNVGAMALGRPWGTHATVAYISCSFSDAYAVSGYGSGKKTDRWCAMSSAVPTVADFREYNSTGAGAITTAVNGGKVMTETEAAAYTKENIFATTNGKLTWDEEWDYNAAHRALMILAGLEQGELPKETKITVNLTDSTLPNGSAVVAAINEKYAGKITWTGTGSFEVGKPQNGVKIGTDTVITCNVAGEVTLVKGYELPKDYVITYKDGKATIKFVAATGQYGTYLGSIVIDTEKIPEDSKTANITLNYNDEGATPDGTLVANLNEAATAPKKPIRDGYVFAGWQLNGADYDWSTVVTGDITLTAKWEVATNFDFTQDVEVNFLTEFENRSVDKTTLEWRGLTINCTADATYASPKFVWRAGNPDIQVNAGTQLSFDIAAGKTLDDITIAIAYYNGASDLTAGTDYEVSIEGSTVTVKFLANTYIKSLSVTYKTATTDPDPAPAPEPAA